MKGDEELMLAAVLGSPEDDSIRLAYADAVQENGDEERAAMIRSRLPCMVCRTTGHTDPPFVGTSTPGGEPIDYDRSPCSWCAAKGWLPFCQYEGCRNAGRLRVIEGWARDPEPDEPDVEEWFCGEHAAEAGYCPSCGSFWGGVDSFERRGICDHCREPDEPAYDDGWDHDFSDLRDEGYDV